MIGIRHLTLLMLFWFIGPLIADDTFQGYGHVTTETQLFAQPTGEKPLALRAPRGQCVGVVDREGDWLQVVLLEVFISSSEVNSDLQTGAEGGSLFVEPDSSSLPLGTVSPNTRLDGYFGDPFSLVNSPSSLSFWLPANRVSLTGLPLRDSDFVRPDQLSIGPKDFQTISALEGLRIVILPTGVSARTELISADSGRFGPSYSVKYDFDGEWLEISCGTDGLGGPDLGEPLYQVQSEVLGKIVVGTMNYGQIKDLFTLNAAIKDGSTADGKPYRLTPTFSCSRGLKEETVRAVLTSLRCVQI